MRYDTGFPLYYSDTQHLGAVNIYSTQDPTTWIDEIKLILNEAERAEIPLDAMISSIQLVNGRWSGTIAPQQQATSLILQVFKEQTNPDMIKRGESNTFAVVPGIILN